MASISRISNLGNFDVGEPISRGLFGALDRPEFAQPQPANEREKKRAIGRAKDRDRDLEFGFQRSNPHGGELVPVVGHVAVDIALGLLARPAA